MENIKILAGIKFSNEEYENIKKRFFNSDEKYIIRYKTIYQLFYSENVGLYSQKIYYKGKSESLGLTRKGRHVFTNAKYINDLLGFKLLNI